MKRNLLMALLSLVMCLTFVLMSCDSGKEKDEDEDDETEKTVATSDSSTDGVTGSSGDTMESGDGTSDTSTESQGLEFVLSADGTSYTLVGIGTCVSEDVVIPSTYNDLPVTSIGDSAFRNCESLTSVAIPNSVISIGSSGFLGCTSLTSVNYLGTIEQWCNISFGDYSANPIRCAGKFYLNGELLTDLVIPNTVTEIKPYAFLECTSLRSVTIGDSVTSIGTSAFQYCYKLIEIYNLSKLNITKGSSGYGNIGYYAINVYTPSSGEKKTFTTEDDFIFYVDEETRYLVGYAGEETSITLPVNCNGENYGIYDYAFFECASLTRVRIPNIVTSIGSFAFKDCTSLESVVIPDSVTTIGHSAFCGCTSLTSVVIPDSVKSIGGYAFYGCTSLTSVVIPDSVTSIARYAFRDVCASLTIYCEVESKLSGWESDWNYSNRPVVWGHTHSYTDGECICGVKE